MKHYLLPILSAVIPASLALAQAPVSLAGTTMAATWGAGTANDMNAQSAAIDFHNDGTFTERVLRTVNRYVGELGPSEYVYSAPISGTYSYSVSDSANAMLTTNPAILYAGGIIALRFTSARTASLNEGSGGGSAAFVATGNTPLEHTLLNVSSLVYVPLNTTITIGFVVAGANVDDQHELLIRAIGPGLASFGIQGFATNPQYTFNPISQSLAPGETGPSYNGVGWSSTSVSQEILSAEAALIGAFPLQQGSTDKADVYVLNPGAYTISVNATNPTETGMELIEVYQVN